MKPNLMLWGLAALTISISSCQKSADQMAPAPSTTGGNMVKSRDFNVTELWSKIYPSTNEPRDTKFGEDNSYFNIDDKPVFYLLITDLLNTDGISGTISFKDVNTGQVFGSYDLVPYYDPSAADLTLPGELVNYALPYMFVRVTFDPEILGHTVDITADLNLVTGEKNSIILQRAFTVL